MIACGSSPQARAIAKMVRHLCASRTKLEDFFNILPDLFLGTLSGLRDSLFVAAAPGMNAFVTALDKKSKHLGDFRLSFQEISG